MNLIFENKRLRMAIQKSGRLSVESQAILTGCGLKINFREQRLIAPIENMPIDLLRVRDDDIPGLVMDGICDLGIIGENVLEEVMLQRQLDDQAREYEILARLNFGECRLSIAVALEDEYRDIRDLEGKTIATTYPRLLSRYLKLEGVNSQVIMLTGSVEIAPRTGLADAICDLVSTGATLEANGLKEVQVIYRSRAVLIQRKGIQDPQQKKLIEKIMPRLQSVMQAKESKYIMLHAPKARLEQVISLLPGAENPTVLPLMSNDDVVAVHAVSSETLFWETMEQLKQLGASSILILPIEKMMD